jgi:hypothetical protein
MSDIMSIFACCCCWRWRYMAIMLFCISCSIMVCCGIFWMVASPPIPIWFTVTFGAGIGLSGFEAAPPVGPIIFEFAPLPPEISPTGVRGPPFPTERGPAGEETAGEPFWGGVGGGALLVGGEVLDGAGDPLELLLRLIPCMLRIRCCIRRLLRRRSCALVSWRFCLIFLHMPPRGQLLSLQVLAWV